VSADAIEQAARLLNRRALALAEQVEADGGPPADLADELRQMASLAAVIAGEENDNGRI
jgi:hypothetical protein